MAEVKTEPVRVTFAADEAAFYNYEDMKARVPGSIWIRENGRWEFACPCGCGRAGAVRVAEGSDAATKDGTWEWNGSLALPTLQPSVRLGDHEGWHWHGWLRTGDWVSA